MRKKYVGRNDHNYWETIKAMPKLKDKISYTWEYYHVPILAVVISLCLLVSIGIGIYHNTAPIFVTGYGINVFYDLDTQDEKMGYLDQELLHGYLKLPENDRTRVSFTANLPLEIDPETNETDYNGTTTLTFLDVRFASHEPDFLLFPAELADVFVGRYEGLMDLSTFLTEEEMEQYQDRLCYTSYGTVGGVDITDTKMVQDMDLMSDGPIYLGFSAYADHPENLRPFFDFVMDGLEK